MAYFVNKAPSSFWNVYAASNLAAWLLFGGYSLCAFATPQTVTTKLGSIAGVEEEHFSVFMGIPYAKPPVGDLRWSPPVPPEPWAGILQATNFKEPCPYLEGLLLPTKTEDDFIGDEDCLYLNIWSPKPKATRENFPVMVFIHGGGFELGGTNQKMFGQFMYDGALLAERGPVVVVTISYRLGALGFMAHPAFGNNPAGQPMTNFGLQDQIAALRWVQGNIAAFGGDPSRVTIFGESAGAMSICALLASPVAEPGLFHRAIQQSGGCFELSGLQALATGNDFATRMGCGSPLSLPEQAACLRKLDVKKVVTNQPSMYKFDPDPPFLNSVSSISGFFDSEGIRRFFEKFALGVRLPFLPVIDGWILPDTPLAMIAQNRHKAVPVILGHTTHEIPEIAINGFDEASFTNLAKSRFGGRANAVIAHYSDKNYGSLNAAISALVTDVSFVCPARKEAIALTHSDQAKVFKYLFDHPLGLFRSGMFGNTFHGTDLPILFFDLNDAWPFMRSESYEIQNKMVKYWTSFAATGLPAGKDLEPWPLFDAKSESFVHFEESVTIGSKYRTVQCDLFQ